MAQRDLPPDEPNPWRRLDRRRVYSNPWIEVCEDRVVTPSGQEGIYGVVQPVHLALGIVPVDEDLHTWLVGQFRYTLDRYSWEIPEGGGRPDRAPELEAARELSEETGISAGRWHRLLELHTSNCFTSERAEIYLARDLTVGTPDPEPTERLQLHRLPLQQACQLVLSGRITDALSAAGLLAAASEVGVRF